MRAEGLHDPARETRIRAEGAHNLPLARRPRKDLGGTSSKNPSVGLIRPAQKLAKSVTESSCKVREPKTYNEVVNNSIKGNRWQKSIDEELWNLDLPAIFKKLIYLACRTRPNIAFIIGQLSCHNSDL